MSYGPDHMRHFKEDLTVAFREDSVEVQGESLERCNSAVSWDLSYGRCYWRITSYRPLQLKIYALNLSISLSAGKESNSDAPSNGE